MKQTIAYSSIIDISLRLDSKTIIYPGDAPLILDTEKSPSKTLTKISMGAHTGTHIDAPMHFISDGNPMSVYNLKSFIGPCRVLDMTGSQSQVGLDEIKKTNPQKGERLLLKTSNSIRGYKEFNNDFVALSPEAAKYLADIGIELIGVDYLGIKKRGASDNTPHLAFFSKNIPILEGLNLSQADPGNYTLVVLPLALSDIEGAPARAVLLMP